MPEKIYKVLENMYIKITVDHFKIVESTVWTVLKNKEMVLKNGVRNIQAAAYNGARMLIEFVLPEHGDLWYNFNFCWTVGIFRFSFNISFGQSIFRHNNKIIFIRIGFQAIHCNDFCLSHIMAKSQVIFNTKGHRVSIS